MIGFPEIILPTSIQWPRGLSSGPNKGIICLHYWNFTISMSRSGTLKKDDNEMYERI